jgi:outer membrane protein assembly factor BamB
MFSPCRIFIVFLACSPVALADNWPAWRGPHGNGRAEEKEAPVEWSRKVHVLWKTALPADGNSTPIVWGERIFVTQPLDKKGRQRAMVCFERKHGKKLWQKVVTYNEEEPTHATNPYASASPATDGERVVASFGSAGLYCYSLEGQELWHYDVGPLRHIWGSASSPVFYGDLVILWCGPGKRQFLVAVDKKTGQKVWEHQEPGGKSGLGKDKEWVGSWATPLIVKVNDHDELILSVPHKVKGFDPKTGRELWSCDGLGPLVYTSPVCSKDGIVVALSGFYGPALAVRAGGRGDVTPMQRLWLWHHTKKNPQRIGSPVIIGDHFYILSGEGIAQCFEVKTGKELWGGQRLGESEAWGSMVHIGDRLYVANNAGDCFVLAASPKFQLLATNRLGETVRGSIIVSNGELFIRSYQHLWCIGR